MKLWVIKQLWSYKSSQNSYWSKENAVDYNENCGVIDKKIDALMLSRDPQTSLYYVTKLLYDLRSRRKRTLIYVDNFTRLLRGWHCFY